MANTYTITVKIEDSIKHPPGHVWLVYEAPGQIPVKVGFYPLQQNAWEFAKGTSAGVIRDDSVTHWDNSDKAWTEPPAAVVRTFTVNPGQFANSLDYMIGKATQTTDNWVVIGDGNQCTGIARNGLLAANIDLNSRAPDTQFGLMVAAPLPVKTLGILTSYILSAVPSNFANELIGVPLDQRKGATSDIAVQSSIPTKLSTLQSLASADEISAKEHRGQLDADIAAAVLEARIQPVGNVVVDSSGATPNASEIQNRVASGLSPDGQDSLGVWIKDDANKQHYWQANADGSVTRIAQNTFDGGSSVTTSTYGVGSASPSSERQTVTGTAGIVYDALLQPDSNGKLALAKISYGSALLIGTAIEIIVSGADLLANDTLGGIAGSKLTITGLTNLRHGTAYLDANGFVHFNPEANYAEGSERRSKNCAANDGKWVWAA